MADYYYNPTENKLLNNHPIDIAFHKDFFDMIHICTCARESDPNAPIEYDRLVQHPEYKLFAEFIPLEVSELPSQLRALLLLHNIG